MKFSTVTLALATASVVAAQPHRARHMHHHEKRVVTETSVVAGPTAVAYVLNGKVVSEAEVEKGIKDGSLIFVSGSEPAASATSSKAAAAFYAKTVSSSSTSTTPTSTYTPSTSSAASTTSSSSASSSSVASSSTSSAATPSGSGVDTDFPDDIDCDTFPSDYGPVALDYLGLNGWTGIQSPTYSGGSVSNIVTNAASKCSEGDYCSYACPAGYQKSQWPSTQGSTGQSVGGITCTNGKLALTNSAFTKLCIPGAGNVSVKNTMSKNVAICRTDYPGTESETIPLNVSPGSSEDLCTPDENTYYQHQNLPTSAQYYVNPAGTSQEDACQWGSAGTNMGNWAPINIGAGMTGGTSWLGMFQNAPTNTDGKFDGTIEIVATEGTLGGTCKYSSGTWSGTGVNPTGDGCTVSNRFTLIFHVRSLIYRSLPALVHVPLSSRRGLHQLLYLCRQYSRGLGIIIRSNRILYRILYFLKSRPCTSFSGRLDMKLRTHILPKPYILCWLRSYFGKGKGVLERGYRERDAGFY
jgi:SUN family beta-glucosidase